MHLPLAYIDPGTGSLVIQVVIAALVSIPIFFRAQVAKGVQAVKRLRDHPTEPIPQSDDPGQPG